MSCQQHHITLARTTCRRRAFTLVELLVVIGIIGLLVAILLPALSRARQAAQSTACTAKLHAMMIAAQLHRSEHREYYPLVGLVPGIQPQTLDDNYAYKYDYFSNQTVTLGQAYYARRLAAITIALSVEMGYKNAIFAPSNTQNIQLLYDNLSYLRNFLCPSQASSFGELALQDPASQQSVLFYDYGSLDSGDFIAPQSYIFNETVLGYYDTLGRYRGLATQVRQPASTMFAADGLHGTQGYEIANGVASYTLYNNTKVAPVTMADALNAPTASNSGIAGDPACFDKKRHRGKINIAFCDGHVETRLISTGDLQNVFLLAP